MVARDKKAEVKRRAGTSFAEFVWRLRKRNRRWQITIKEGRVQESNFNDYQVPRMSDMTSIEVRVISTDNPPTGAGEDGLPPVGGAIGNAVAALTGVRLRELPFAPDRVRGALGA